MWAMSLSTFYFMKTDLSLKKVQRKENEWARKGKNKNWDHKKGKKGSNIGDKYFKIY